MVVEAALFRLTFSAIFSTINSAGGGDLFCDRDCCRLTYPVLAGSTRYPIGISALIIIMLLPYQRAYCPVLVWMLVYLGLIVVERENSHTLYAQIHRRVWENPLILYFGSRSYSIYLTHMLTITLCHFLWMKLQPMAGPMETFVALSIMTVPVTMAVAEVLYRSVEQPALRSGRGSHNGSTGRRFLLWVFHKGFRSGRACRCSALVGGRKRPSRLVPPQPNIQH